LLPAERLKEMEEHIERLKEQGVEAIDRAIIKCAGPQPGSASDRAVAVGVQISLNP